MPCAGFAEAVRRLDPGGGPGDVLALELLEVADARHDVVALGRMPGLRPLERPLGLFLVLDQVLHGVPHRVHAGVGRVERDEDELVAEVTQLLEPEGIAVGAPLERRGVVEREWHVRMRLAQRAGEGDGWLTARIGELGPDQVGAGIRVGAAPPDRLVQAAAHGAERVGASDDDEVGILAVADLDGGAIFPDRLFASHDGLAGDVAAALRELLVLDVDAGDAGLDELLDCSHGAQRVAVAVIGIRDDRNLDRTGHHRRDAGHLGHGEEPHVRPAVGEGHGVAAQVDRLHADALGDLRIERRVHTAGEDVGLVVDQVPEGSSLRFQ